MAAAGLAAGLRDRCFHVPAAVGGHQPGAGVASSLLPGQSRQGRGGGSRLGVPVAGPAVLHGGFLDSPARPGAGRRRGRRDPAGRRADRGAFGAAARGHLDEVQVLVRLRNDRVLYRDPPPRLPGRPGRPRKHGSGADRFECKNPATWGPPDQELSLHDDRYGQVSVMSWSGLHPKLFCRGRFAGFAEPPVIKCHLIRVTVTLLPNGRKVPGPLWLWWAGPGAPDLDLIWRAYLHRFDIEHTYRLAKNTLGWDKAALRDPGQVSRWTWLIIAAITQLRLARPVAEDHRQRWERRRKPGKLTPARERP